MSQPFDTTITQPLGTTSARLVAVRLKSANKYIFRALLSLASANLLIRIAGLLNQVIVTARFGQGESMDAYFVASALPLLLAQLLASALEASVIPIYTRVRTQAGRQQASRLFSTLLNLLVIAMISFTILMLVFRGQVIFFSAPGLRAYPRDLAVDLTAYIFPVLILMVMNSFMECLLNSEGQFGWPAYAGVLVPITTALLVLLEGKSYGVLMLCIGTLLGQFLQLLIIILRARKAKLIYRPIVDLHQPDVIAVAKVAWPYLFAALISQASPLVDQMFASSLSSGSIAALNNALKLSSVPTGVIFASIGRAALPYLAHQATIKDMKAFKDTLRLYSWAVAIGTIAITVAMILLAYPLVQILFQHGSFSAEDTARTASTLIGFAIGLTPMALGFIMSRALSALGKSTLLMYVTIFSVFANAIFDYIFVSFWQSFGIAVATSVIYTCTMVILMLMLRATIGKLYFLTPPHEILSVMWKSEYLARFRLPYQVRRRVVRACFATAVFIAGSIAVVFNNLLALRIAFGSIIILFLLRYRYYLLVAWGLLAAFIGSSLPLFNGNNFLSGLTLPTVLLLFYLPTKEAFKRMPALAFFLAFVLWVLLGVGISQITPTEFFTIWTTYLDYVAVAVLTIFVITTRKRLLGVIDLFLAITVFICCYGIYGYFTKHGGVVDTSTSLFRISSVFADSPPTLAMFLSIIFPLVLYRTFTLQGYKRVFGVLLALLSLVTLVLTFSRGAYLSVAGSMIILVLFLPSKKLKVGILSTSGILAAIAYLVITVGNIPIFSRFFNQDLTTLNGRTYLWQAVIDHFDPTRLLGYGLKGSDILLTNVHVGFGRGLIATATHNIFLETLYDHGLIGVTLLVLTLLTLAVSLLAKARNTSFDHRMLLAAVLAIFFNVLVQSNESNDIWNQSVGIYFWIAMALPFALCWSQTEAPQASEIKEVSNDEDNDITEPGLGALPGIVPKELSSV
ncbi:MAG: murein biosynthesis integral membrane protein MurJ [Ktedonobacteraceae bacterium]|nr:murein biosynthesis integral membrane protein MurJ [Ktedonobacteraceae bacterium]